MRGTLRLYPPVKVIGKSFKHCKVIVVPDQSMKLSDIIRRFIRGEALPVSKEGFYAEGHGDLEKMSKDDLSVLHERRIALRERSIKEKADADAKAKADADAAAKAIFDDAVNKAVESRLSNAPPVSGA